MRLAIDSIGRWREASAADDPLAEEAQMVRAAQKGDRGAFAQLYEDNVASIFRYLCSRAGTSDAEDITANVFIKAMRGLPSYRHNGAPFVAWLLQIARNELANFYKKQQKQAHAPLDDQIVASLSAPDNPEQSAIRLTEIDRVRSAMGQLTELQREVLRLRFDAQLSVSETAQAMKRNEGAVKVLQHSALRALRRALGDDAR